MARMPRPSGKEMVRFLRQRGFNLIRISGSHHFFDDGKHRTSVPVHGDRPLKTGTLRSILRDIELSPADFEREWHS